MRQVDMGLEAERLRALETTGLLSGGPSGEFQEICRRAARRFGVPVAMVTLVGEDKLLVKARVGTDLDEAPRLHQFCDAAVLDREVLVVPDASRDRRFAGNPMVAGEPFIRFYAGAPLAYVRDIRLGALCLLDTVPRDLETADKAELERMADEVVSLVIDREFDRMAADLFH